jgi:hypothetical protein
VKSGDPQNYESVDELYEIEVVDAEIVEHRQAAVEPDDGDHVPVWVSQPAMQTAVAAATGFVAGAATMALLHRFAPRTPATRAGHGLRAGTAHSYVVHVRSLRPFVD